MSGEKEPIDLVPEKKWKRRDWIKFAIWLGLMAFAAWFLILIVTGGYPANPAPYGPG